jgi:hypothetical protein
VEKKMNKYTIGLLSIGLLFSSSKYYGSTTAPITIAGGIIKAKHIDENIQKYKRKDCPVCKGKGWYMSGDDIKKIECNYCEPDTDKNGSLKAPSPPGRHHR